jgi:DNA-binding response OmpR family regulator
MRFPVLLVDDDEFARCFVRMVLERAGYEVHEADDAAGALALAEAENPVAVITDWNLLDSNGGDLARSLHDYCPSLPIILITGEAEGSSLLAGDAMSEFTSILYKPFPPSALEKTIRAAIKDVSPLVTDSSAEIALPCGVRLYT